MLFTVINRDKPGALNVRMDNRPAHLEYLTAAGAALTFAGPILNEDGGPCGSVLMVEMADLAAVQDWAAADPYAKAGLFASTEILPVKQVFPQG